MTPGEVAALRAQLTALIDQMEKRFDKQDEDYAEFRREQRADMHELRRDVKDVKVEVKKTNGRVTALETRDAKEDGERTAREQANAANERTVERRLSFRNILVGAFAAAVFLIPGYLAIDLLVQLLHLHP